MSNLSSILALMTELYEKLLETAKNKHEILIRSEINPLLGVLAEESKLIKKINEAEKQRAAVMEGTVTLSEMIERTSDMSEKQELASHQAKMQQLITEISQINQANQQLIEQSLVFTNFMMEQILPKSDGSGVYSPKADSKEKGESVRLFDVKA
jgi:flagellar biosynthesis/type III secretory pathway chaperone